MSPKPLLVLAALAAATSPDMGRSALERFKDGTRETFARDPMGGALAAVLGGAWLFYRAERDANARVGSFYDALSYVSTCLSGGFTEVTAETPRGKAIGAAMRTYGPAMAAKIFDTPRAEAPRAEGPSAEGPRAAKGLPADEEVVARLDRIVALLEELRASRTRTES